MFHLLEDLPVKTKFLYQIKVKNTSHLINGMSPNITKILKNHVLFFFFFFGIRASIHSCIRTDTAAVIRNVVKMFFTNGPAILLNNYQKKSPKFSNAFLGLVLSLVANNNSGGN